MNEEILRKLNEELHNLIHALVDVRKGVDEACDLIDDIVKLLWEQNEKNNTVVGGDNSNDSNK